MFDDGWSHLEIGGANYGEEASSKKQLDILFRTLDLIIDRYGTVGRMIVNDLTPEMTQYAGARLREYASAKGYRYVTVELLPGDIFTLDPPVTFTSAFKNPDQGCLDKILEGRNLFQELAERTFLGMEVHTNLVMMQLLRHKLGLQYQQLGEAPPYIDGSGTCNGEPFPYRDAIGKFLVYPSISLFSRF
jgi:hypothetical protein